MCSQLNRARHLILMQTVGNRWVLAADLLQEGSHASRLGVEASNCVHHADAAQEGGKRVCHFCRAARVQRLQAVLQSGQVLDVVPSFICSICDLPSNKSACLALGGLQISVWCHARHRRRPQLAERPFLQVPRKNASQRRPCTHVQAWRWRC